MKTQRGLKIKTLLTTLFFIIAFAVVLGIHIHQQNLYNSGVEAKATVISVDAKRASQQNVTGSAVYTDENGNIMADEEMMKHCHFHSKGKSIWNKFPFYIFAIVAFAWWGASGVCYGWALSWICFLTIPLYYTLGDAIFKRNPSHFAYPVLAVIAYILFGFFNVCGGWALGWLVFLTIPVYYWICGLFGDKDDEECECCCNECE